MSEHIVDDPIVPIEIQLAGGSRVTLYQPGWTVADDGSEAVLGSEGTIYVFPTLADLAEYLGSESEHDLTASPAYAATRGWSVADLTERLCRYDLGTPPAVASSPLDADQQSELGSLLGLLLDLLEYADVDDEHAEALQNDADVEALTSGEHIPELATDDARRSALADLLDTHFAWCVASVIKHVGRPGAGASTNAGAAGKSAGTAAANTSDDDDPQPLEEVVDAVTLWFAFEEDGLYTVRTTTLHDGAPVYAAEHQFAGARTLLAADDPETLRAAYADKRTDDLAGIGLTEVAQRAEVSFTPSDECIFDLVEIGESITAEMTADQADVLVSAWTELVRLATWGSWADAIRLLSVDEPIGAFVTSCAVDLAQERPGADRALATADVDQVRARWNELVTACRRQVKPLEG